MEVKLLWFSVLVRKVSFLWDNIVFYLGSILVISSIKYTEIEFYVIVQQFSPHYKKVIANKITKLR